jgi:hypothetical protein
MCAALDNKKFPVCDFVRLTAIPGRSDPGVFGLWLVKKAKKIITVQWYNVGIRGSPISPCVSFSSAVAWHSFPPPLHRRPVDNYPQGGAFCPYNGQKQSANRQQKSPGGVAARA